MEDDLQSAEEQEHDPDIIETQPIASVPGNETFTGLELGKNTDVQAKNFPQEAVPVVAANDDPVYRLVQTASASGELPKADEAVLPPFQLDCWSVTSCVLAAQDNQTIGVQQFCPSTHNSLNVSYIVPVSRYLQASSLEVHLRLVSRFLLEGLHLTLSTALTNHFSGPSASMRTRPRPMPMRS